MEEISDKGHGPVDAEKEAVSYAMLDDCLGCKILKDDFLECDNGTFSLLALWIDEFVCYIVVERSTGVTLTLVEKGEGVHKIAV